MSPPARAMTFDEATVIFETVHGSRAYGLATAASDLDRRGVFVPESVLPEQAANVAALSEFLVEQRRQRFA